MNTNYSLLVPKCFVLICILGMGECGQIYLLTHKLLDKKGLYTDEIENTVYHPESLDFDLGTVSRYNLGLYPLGSGGTSSMSRKVNEPV